MRGFLFVAAAAVLASATLTEEVVDPESIAVTSLYPSYPTEASYSLYSPHPSVASPSPSGISGNESYCSSLTPGNSSTFWYEKIHHNGRSPFLGKNSTWTVFRNVKTAYGAHGDGIHDDAQAIQNALDAGNSYGNRSSGALGTTGQPVVIYLPSGTYMMSKPIQLFVGTVLMGDPTNPPVIKATTNYTGDYLVYGKDPNQGSTTNFYITMKNLQLDSSNINKAKSFTLLDWSVSQATQLTNVVFNMPKLSNITGNYTGHTGLSTPEGGSGTYMGDLTFRGGAIGINLNNQQYLLKSITFDGCAVGVYLAHGFDTVFQNCTFMDGDTGIDMTPGDRYNIGSVTVLDSTGSNLKRFVKTLNSGTADRNLILENIEIQNSGPTVVANGTGVYSGSVADTWVMGTTKYVPGGPTTGMLRNGTTLSTPRSSVLLDDGKYLTIPPPTYQEYAVDQFINVKDVYGYPVYGDGVTDDTKNINYILSKFANCKIIFFPAGTYLVIDTIFVPIGSRLVGEVWSAISASGSKFMNAQDPTVMVKVGNSGDKGVVQFSDMLFTVADILPGCQLLEVNIAGDTPGDVAFWNTHFRVGGAKGSKVQTNCGSTPDKCKAAFGLLHLTSTSSVYIEDMWGWTADHDLDGTNDQTISTGRGALIEATAGTWLLGTTFEHHTLYQYNLNNAQNIYIGMQQSETPYWQGPPQNVTAPAPWIPLARYSDPTFSNCNSTGNSTIDAQCRMAWYEQISNVKDAFIYGSGFWTFFNNLDSTPCGGNDGECQTNSVNILGSTNGLYIYGLNTRGVRNLVVNFGRALVTRAQNPGGWGGTVAAMLADS
ncbi:MAG: hypothetical protein M1834_004392 [Cirrosporium novae-zelandiae]|nr:MAG: hypothetical protein M1834_004392 [Cirrosporium novae-zelandiae]